MTIILWDAYDVIHCYLGNGNTMTGKYNTILADHVMKKSRVNAVIQLKKVLCYRYNVPVSISKFHELNFQLVPYAPYSTDLVPCNLLENKRFSGIKF